MDLVFEVHVVDARLHLEAAALDAEAALDVVRGLGLQLEVAGDRSEEGRSNDGPDDTRSSTVGRAERARGAAEYREHVVEAMLEADMQRVLRFVAVERGGLSAARKNAAQPGALGRIDPGRSGWCSESGRHRRSRSSATGRRSAASSRPASAATDRRCGSAATPLNAPRSWSKRRIVVIDAGQDRARAFRRSSS